MAIAGIGRGAYQCDCDHAAPFCCSDSNNSRKVHNDGMANSVSLSTNVRVSHIDFEMLWVDVLECPR